MIKTKLIVMLAAIAIISAGAGSTFTSYADNITDETEVINVEDEEESIEETENYGATAPLLIGCNITGEIKAGNIVTVPVYLDGTTRQGDLDSCCIKLKYNTDVFEVVNIEAGELCNSEECLNSKVDKENINLDFISFDAEGFPEPLERDGVLANIKLKVKDDYDGTQPIKITADEITYINSMGQAYKGSMGNSHFQLPASVKVSLEEDSEPGCINPSFIITNTTGREINLEGMVIEYYYTS